MIASTKPILAPSKPELIEILKGTLKDVDHEPDLDPKDPKVIEWKASIRQSLAELQSDWARAA